MTEDLPSPAALPAAEAEGERLAKRLRVFKSLAVQAQERGDTHIEFHRDEIWTVEDEAALNAFENWALEHSGAQPLFPV